MMHEQECQRGVLVQINHGTYKGEKVELCGRPAATGHVKVKFQKQDKGKENYTIHRSSLDKVVA